MHSRDLLHKALLSILLFWTSALFLKAQTHSGSLTGRIYDGEQKEWMIAAGVKLLQPKDSVLVKGSLSDTNGRFKLSAIKPGTYLLQVSYVGYADYFSKVTVGSENKNMGTITLSPSATALKEVQVVGQATPVVMKTDTVQFNADAFRTQQNANVEDLLRKIPGMEIDDDGNITYNGESIERIELDGRDFFSGNPTMATRNLPSNMIKNVQVVDKKSDQARLTGVDDGERVKVLNLNVKEDKKKGVLANLTAGYGTQKRYNTQANVNYFNGDARYTLLGNLNNIDGVRRGRGDRTTRSLGFNYNNKFGDKVQMTAEAEYHDNDNSTIGSVNTQNFLGDQNSTYENRSYNNFSNRKSAEAMTRLEWNPSERTSIIARPSFDWRRTTSNNQDDFTTTNDAGELINRGNSRQFGQTDGIDADMELHFRHTFNDLGRNIYVRAAGNYGKSNGFGIKNSLTDFLSKGTKEVIDQRTTTDDSNRGYGVRASYLEPFNSTWALQLNYRLDAQNRYNNQFAYNKDTSGEYTVLDTDYSRGSTNENMVHRFGFRVRYSFLKKSNIYAGFEASPTMTHTTTSNGLETTFDKSRTVWNYAPAFTVDIRPTDTLRVMVRYNGRTTQPSMMQLNNVPIINSPLSTTVGNPDLLPSFSHSLRANVQFNRRAQRQSFGLFGSASFTNDAVISKRTIDKSTGASVNTYENVDGLRNLWLGFSVNTPIGGAKSKWTSFTFGNLSYNRSKAYVNDALNTADTFRPHLAQRFTWSGDNLQATTGVFLSVQSAKNSISTELNRTTYDYNIFNELVWTLPLDLSLTSRLSYQDASGYNDAFNRRLWLWDASLSWAFLSDKSASLELSAYDLLRQRTTYTRIISANSIVDQNVNGITSYFMLTFTYRFNNFGGGAPQSEAGRRGPGGYGGGRRPLRF